MKLLFNTFLFLALFAFAAEIADSFFTHTQEVTSEIPSDADQLPDEDVPQPDAPDNDTEEFETKFASKDWIFGTPQYIEPDRHIGYQRILIPTTDDRYTELLLADNLYSPPEAA